MPALILQVEESAQELIEALRSDCIQERVATEVARQVEKHEREVLEYASPGTPLSALWQAIYLLGGDLPEPARRWLSEWLIRPSDPPRPPVR